MTPRARAAQPDDPTRRDPRDGDASAISLHHRAMENLRYIRDRMDRAAFTAVSGWGHLLAGVTAIAAAAIASRVPPRLWLPVWLADAAVGLALTTLFSLRKARRTGASLVRGAGRKFVLGFAPPALAAVVLTPAISLAGAAHVLPGLWLMLYGAGITTAGAFSVRPVPAMGAAFMLTGTVALAFPAWGDLWMGVGFGGVHVAFGWWIARRHGG